jgi:hypothetical protein
MTENKSLVNQMGQNARNEFLNKYTSEINKSLLLDVYQQAINGASSNE